MKRKDIPLILIVGFMSAVFAIVLSRLMFNSAKDHTLTAEVVTPITPEFNNAPDKRYFNQESIDPTQIIRTRDNANTQPFQGR